MKVAVTYQNGEIFQHFGHTEQFKIYTVEDGKVTSEEICSADGFGHGTLAGFLKDLGVDTLICGGIGGGARNALGEAGIEIYPGVTGNADEKVKEFLEGKLAYNPDTVCAHHEHEHSCKDHGDSCGSHEHSCSSGHGSCH